MDTHLNEHAALPSLRVLDDGAGVTQSVEIPPEEHVFLGEAGAVANAAGAKVVLWRLGEVRVVALEQGVQLIRGIGEVCELGIGENASLELGDRLICGKGHYELSFPAETEATDQGERLRKAIHTLGEAIRRRWPVDLHTSVPVPAPAAG